MSGFPQPESDASEPIVVPLSGDTTGVTDLAAITAALAIATNAAGAGTGTGGRRVVQLQPGQYYAEGIDLTGCNKVALRGVGRERSVIQAPTGAQAIIKGSGASIGYVELEGFTAFGNQLGGNGIDLTGFSGFLRLADVEALRCADGFKFASCFGVASAYRCISRLNTGWGFNLTSVNDEFQLDHCDADTCGVQNRTTGTINSGTNTLTVAAAGTIASGDIIIVAGAGPASLTTNNGSLHLVTFVTNVAGTTITLNDNAGTSVVAAQTIAARGGGYRLADLWHGPWVGSKANGCSVGILLETSTATKNLYNPTFLGGEVEGGAGATIDQCMGFVSRALGNKITNLSVHGLALLNGYGIGCYLGGLTGATVDVVTKADGTGLFTHLEVGADSTDVIGRQTRTPAAGETLYQDAGVNTLFQSKSGLYGNLAVHDDRAAAADLLVLDNLSANAASRTRLKWRRANADAAIAYIDSNQFLILQTLTNAARIQLVPNASAGAKVETSRAFVPGLAAPAYSASITPDASAGNWQTITVTNGNAFTVNAPSNPPDSSHTQALTIEVLNSSGGVMGVVTWNAAFVFDLGVWVNPANTKKRQATFNWNGSVWVCTDLSTADY